MARDRADFAAPEIVDRATFQAEVDLLRVRERCHTREGDAIAAVRRRLPMVKVDGATPLMGKKWAGNTAGRLRGAPDARRLLLHVVRCSRRRPHLLPRGHLRHLVPGLF